MSGLRPLEVIIVSRVDCHFCEVVVKMTEQIREEIPLVVKKLSVDDDPALLASCGSRVPVVLIDGVEGCAGIFTEGDLRRALRRARWRRPISRILSCLGYAPKQG